MYKSFIFILIVIFVNACGVDTASSQTEIPEVIPPSYDISNNDLINLNPISTDTDLPDDGNITDPDDGNITDPDDGNITDPDDGNTTLPNDGSISEFDIDGAIEDKYACIVGDYNNGYTNNIITDSSYDYVGKSDEEDGVTINSGIRYYDDPLLSTVALFYYDLKPARAMDMVSVFEDGYTMYVDQAWAINDETTMYVRTPKNENDLYGCYRYDLSEIDTGVLPTRTKVYRIIIEE